LGTGIPEDALMKRKTARDATKNAERELILLICG
jgi:hypothetical protein